MPNSEHLEILREGVGGFNEWRVKNPEIIPDLSKAILTHADLSRVDFSGANLIEAHLSFANLERAILSDADLSGAELSAANLRGTTIYRGVLIKTQLIRANLFGADLNRAKLLEADLTQADLNGAILSEAHLNGAELSEASLINTELEKADLRRTNLSKTNLSGANLNGANLTGTNLNKADLSYANLNGANLNGASLIGAKLNGANLFQADLRYAILVDTTLEATNISSSRIYGISAWNLTISQKTKQFDLIITQHGEPEITVDNLEVAQFVYLLLKNENIRNVIDTIGKKGVLILGRFTEERKAVLDAIRNKLRELGFVPMMFDFEKPTQRDFTETIKTLAGMSRFIIADITNPKSSPLELQATMPDYMIPFVPIIQEDEEPFSMFRDLKQKYGEWVLDPLKYDTAQGLLDVFDDAVVEPANEMGRLLELKKAEQIRTRHVKDYKKG